MCFQSPPFQKVKLFPTKRIVAGGGAAWLGAWQEAIAKRRGASVSGWIFIRMSSAVGPVFKVC
jgi:hypothetical protein